GPKFFYTRSLPCTLWFFDKGKPKKLLDTVLMIDARNVYTVVSARSHVFTDEQLSNLSAITWLYRGQHAKFLALLASYQQQVVTWLATLPDRLAQDGEKIQMLSAVLANFAELTRNAEAVQSVRTKLGEEHGLTDEVLSQYRDELQAVQLQTQEWGATVGAAQDAAAKLFAEIQRPHASFAARKKLQAKLEVLNPQLKAALAAVEACHKAWLKLLDNAEKPLRARQWTGFDGDSSREAKKALLPRDVKKREPATVRDRIVEALKRSSYFIAQGHWLLSRFPDGEYADVPGLCKAVSRDDMAPDYSLTPGRYVGVAVGLQEDDDGEAFAGRMREVHDELAELNERATTLAASIQTNFAGMFE
ncbi:MAG TPA: N-6 DNA methylase, partial [Gallionellaceae bacterium]